MAGQGAVLFDVDGVLVVSWEPLPGAADAVESVRATGHPVRFLTNTTSRTRAEITDGLRVAGIAAEPEEVVTATSALAAHLRSTHPGARCVLLNHGDLGDDLAGVRVVAPGTPPEEVDVVVVGGAGPEFGYDALNHALACVDGGAALVAAHRNTIWRTSEGIKLDAGPFVVALEVAAGIEATVVGKPAASMFIGALDELGAAPSDSVMVGDDLVSDVRGAQQVGMVGVLVRTGKFRAEQLDDGGAAPDAVLDSVADLPGWLSALANPRG